jgi:hypothetical protein
MVRRSRRAISNRVVLAPQAGEEFIMGELLDRLNEVDPRPHAPGEPIKTANDRIVAFVQLAGERVNQTVAEAQRPGMPLDRLSRWTQRSPLQALAAAFLVGVIVTRRRR